VRRQKAWLGVLHGVGDEAIMDCFYVIIYAQLAMAAGLLEGRGCAMQDELSDIARGRSSDLM
jgi:hypothetical protein